MDSTLLRMILLALGILVLVGIYFWETKRRARRPLQAKRREAPEIGDLNPAQPEDSGWRYEDREPDNIDAELAQLAQQVQEDSSDQPVPRAAQGRRIGRMNNRRCPASAPERSRRSMCRARSSRST